METNVIKMRFTNDGKPYGMEYTYYTPEEVQVGDYVEVKTDRGVSIGQVAEINVPLEEIERFGDRAKYILGKHIQEEEQEELENEQQ